MITGQSISYGASKWFENIQPQLNNRKFFGRPVAQTMLKSGDVLYLPSENSLSLYAPEDSLMISRRFLSISSLDSYILNEENNYSNIDQFSDIMKIANKIEKKIIEKTLELKKDWKNFEESDMEMIMTLQT